MSRKNPGQLLQLKDGRKGITYHKDPPVNGKVLVYVVDDKYQHKGARFLVDPKSCTVIGYTD